MDKISKNLFDPELFLRALNEISSTKFYMNSWQLEVLQELSSQMQPLIKNLVQNHKVNKNIYISVAGCRGSGKSRLLAFIGLWALSVFSNYQTVVTISANTENQIEKSVWLAYEQLYNDLPFRIFLKREGKRCIASQTRQENKTYWQILGHDNNLTKIRGTHADVTIREFDEASGISPETFHTVLSGLVKGLNIILVFGNPVSTVGFFADIYLGANLYNFYKKNIAITDCDHLNINSEEMQNHIESVRRSDPTGDRYRVEILGQFPQNSISFFFSTFDVQECDLNLMPPIFPDSIIGIDVAGGTGNDRTVIAHRRENTLSILFVGQMNTAMLSQEILNKYLLLTKNVCIDAVAIGLGVVQNIQYQGGYVYQIHGSQPSSNPCALNRRAELYIQLKAFLDSGVKILVPYGQKNILIDELQSIKIDEKEQKYGKLKMSSKTDLPNSPDMVDALTYTFAIKPPTYQPIFYY